MIATKQECPSCNKKRELTWKGVCSECSVLVLDVKAIKDYQVCELFYDFRYRQKEFEIINTREMMADRFENTLKRVASYFFYKKQADIIPSYNALLNRWEKLWFPKNMTAYDLAIEQHESAHGNLASYSNKAAAALEEFHDDFARDSGIPIIIDEPFLVSIDSHLRLEGRIDLVLKRGDRYKLFKWRSRSRKAAESNLDMAAQRLAFDNRNDKPRMTQYVSYDLSGRVPSRVNTPRNADVDSLVYWAREIDRSTTFVPRRGYTAYCKGCPFDRQCAEFEDWPT